MAILEDPSSSIPCPQQTALAAPRIAARAATLKSGARIELRPVFDPAQLPAGLLCFLHNEFSAEVARGCTYPMDEPMTRDSFARYWFGTFAVVALRSEGDSVGDVRAAALGQLDDRPDWDSTCLGTFYIKPNYPGLGRCSHVCNAGFMTIPAARGQGVGTAMGRAYLDIARELGYRYSVFNLVFANNLASIQIWKNLGFQIIGRVPAAARLENSKELVDALIFGKDLTVD